MTEVRPAVHPSAALVLLSWMWRVKQQLLHVAWLVRSRKTLPLCIEQLERLNLKSKTNRYPAEELTLHYIRTTQEWEYCDTGQPIITVQQFHLTASGPKCNSLLLRAHTRMMMAQRKLLFEWWRKWERFCYIFMVFSFCTLKVNRDHLLIVPTCLRVLGNKEDSCIKYRKRRGKT